jgi:competence protein ComEC
VISNLRVKEIWEGRPAWKRKKYRDLRDCARARGVPFKQLSTGDRMSLGRVWIEVLFSSHGTKGETAGENDDSLVLHFGYGRAGVLLTGDAGEKTELGLVRSKAIRQSDVLKVGHHGSRSSTAPAFLEAVSPRVAVISTRGSTFFRMPSVRVLERLRESGAAVYRTDRDGAVTVSLTEDGTLRVETYRVKEGKIHEQ